MDIKSNYDKQADKCRKEFINMDHQKIAICKVMKIICIFTFSIKNIG